MYIITYRNIDDTDNVADFFDTEEELLDAIPEYWSEGDMEVWEAKKKMVDVNFLVYDEEEEEKTEDAD